MNEKENLGEGIAINSEEDIAKLKEQIDEEVIADNTPNDKQNELFKQAIEEASLPVKMTDKDFELGDAELDIRGLNAKNREQMFFRQGVVMIATCRQIMTSVIDCTRLLMVIADKLGVEDIVQATDEVIEKVTAKNQELRDIMKRAKEESKA